MESQSSSFGVGLPRITLSEYFMGIAIISSKQSEKGCYPVGACIVNKDQTIVATGYNTLHKGWTKEKDARSLFACHAEVAAILNKTSRDVKGCTMYVTRFPCNNCANRIISSGIREVIYCDLERNYSYTTKRIRAAKELFAANNVIYNECITIYDKLLPKAYDKFSRPTNEECFMGIAYLSSKQSTNINKIGACIVNNNNIIVGVGYNGFSRKMGQISINPSQKNIPASYFEVCYADFIINSIQSTSCDVKNCTIYVTSFPCNESAKVIARSGIKTVIYLHKNIDDKTTAAKRIFDADNVKYMQCNVAIAKIEMIRSAITSNAATKDIKENKTKENKTKEEQTIKDGKKKKKNKKKKNKEKKQEITTNKIKNNITADLNTTVGVIEKKQIKTINNPGGILQTVQYWRNSGGTGGILAANISSTEFWDYKSGAVLVIDTASILEFNINTASLRRLF